MSISAEFMSQGRTPSRFLSNYFSSQCNIYGEGPSWGCGTLSQNDSGSGPSQDGMFGTPDFITPQEHQFSVGHNEGDSKEIKPMRSPCQLSPAGRKKPKTFVFNSQDSELDLSQEPSSSSQPDLPPLNPNRGSILHYVKTGRPGTSSARKRGIMAPPPIRSPPAIRNPFLEDTSAKSEDKSSRPKVTGQPPSSRYRADFKEIGILGSGAFNKVYKAKGRIDGAEYAIKRSIRQLCTASERNEALQEVQAFAAVGSHPNLVRYFAAWMEPAGDGEHLFIQLELCGNSLSGMLESGHQFKEAELLDILKQVAAGLRHLHDQGMAHLDIKPDNIYMSVDEKLYKVGDFGLVTRLDGTTKVNEGDGRYMPQEMLNGDYSHLDKVDMFSLGLTLLELARGEPLPKDGAAYQAIRKGKAPMPQRFSPSSLLIRSIKAMLSESPSERPTADAICRGSVSRGGLGLVLQPSNLNRTTGTRQV